MFCFGLHPIEVVVLRTAAADVQSVLPSILGIDSLARFTDILIVKHTNCGGLILRDAKIKEGLLEFAPHSTAEVQNLKFPEILGLVPSHFPCLSNVNTDVRSQNA